MPTLTVVVRTLLAGLLLSSVVVGDDPPRTGQVVGHIHVERDAALEKLLNGPDALDADRLKFLERIVGRPAPGENGRFGLSGAVVHLAAAPEGGAGKPPRRAHVLQFKDASLWPRLSVVRAGQPLFVSNLSRQRFHASWITKNNGSGSVVVGGRSIAERPVVFAKPEASLVQINDAGGPGVFGRLLVLDHPFHALTDSGGRFELAGLPEGEHVLHVQHELSAGVAVTLKVRVRAGQLTELEDLVVARIDVRKLVWPVRELSPRSTMRPSRPRRDTEYGDAIGGVERRTRTLHRRSSYADVAGSSTKELLAHLQGSDGDLRRQAARCLVCEPPLSHDDRDAPVSHAELVSLVLNEDPEVGRILLRALESVGLGDHLRDARVVFAVAHGAEAVGGVPFLDPIDPTSVPQTYLRFAMRRLRENAEDRLGQRSLRRVTRDYPRALLSIASTETGIDDDVLARALLEAHDSLPAAQRHEALDVMASCGRAVVDHGHDRLLEIATNDATPPTLVVACLRTLEVATPNQRLVSGVRTIRREHADRLVRVIATLWLAACPITDEKERGELEIGLAESAHPFAVAELEAILHDLERLRAETERVQVEELIREFGELESTDRARRRAGGRNSR